MKSFKLQQQIRKTAVLFIIILIVSGLTAFPLETELNILLASLRNHPNAIYLWINKVTNAVHQMNMHYPFLAYGTDWLAFAHIIIALFFIGVYKDPVKNIWITQIGIIACFLIFPLALIAGYIREVPIFWQLIDCSFGALGLIPLLYIHHKTNQLISTTPLYTYQ